MRSVIVVSVTSVWLLMGCRGAETRTNRVPSGNALPPGPSGPLAPIPDPGFFPAAPLHGPVFPSTSSTAPQLRTNGATPVHGSFGGTPAVTPTISLPRSTASAPLDRWTAPTGSLTAPGEPALFPPGSYREMPSAH